MSEEQAESVSFAEHQILKCKYEDLLKEHETLVLTVEVLKKKYSEVKKTQDKIEKDLQYLNSSDSVDSGVIEVSSDDEEGNQRESSGGGQHSKFQNQEKVSFI